MKSKIIKTAIVLAVLALVAIVIVGLSMDGIVKRGVETVGPKLTQVEVKLDKVGLSLFSGSGKVEGLVVGNPTGFKSAQAISVGSASLALSPGSVLSHKIVIKSIKVEAPEITYETGLGGSNLKKILANLNEATGGSGAQSQDTSSGKKLEVDDFLLTGAKLHLSLTGVGSATVPLPEIHLTNLGQGDEGITSAELTKEVLAAIEQAAAKTAATSAGTIAKGAMGLGKKAAGSAGGAIEKIGQGVNNLLK